MGVPVSVLCLARVSTCVRIVGVCMVTLLMHMCGALAIVSYC